MHFFVSIHIILMHRVDVHVFSKSFNHHFDSETKHRCAVFSLGHET